MTDPIADFLTRIRNIQMVKKNVVKMPFSNMKYRIAKTMMKNKFIKTVEKDETEKFPQLVLGLLDKEVVLRRISKPGQRIYVKAENIYKSMNGFGIFIISTSKGVMTGYQARSMKLGGELLCEVQ